MLQLVLALAAEPHEELAPLFMPVWAFPLVAAVVFAGLGFVTWSFRDVANRHSQKAGKAHDSHGAGH